MWQISSNSISRPVVSLYRILYCTFPFDVKTLICQIWSLKVQMATRRLKSDIKNSQHPISKLRSVKRQITATAWLLSWEKQNLVYLLSVINMLMKRPGGKGQKKVRVQLESAPLVWTSRKGLYKDIFSLYACIHVGSTKVLPCWKD